MKPVDTTDVINRLTAINTAHSSDTYKKAFRDALVALVDLAKAEQIRQMQEDFRKCTDEAFILKKQ